MYIYTILYIKTITIEFMNGIVLLLSVCYVVHYFNNYNYKALSAHIPHALCVDAAPNGQKAHGHLHVECG